MSPRVVSSFSLYPLLIPSRPPSRQEGGSRYPAFRHSGWGPCNTGTSPSQPPDNGLIICSVIGARASQTCGRHARWDQAPPLRDAAASWLGGVLVGERPAIISRVNLDEVEGATELGSHAEVDFRVHISIKYAQRCPASLLSPSSAHALSPDRTCLRKLFPLSSWLPILPVSEVHFRGFITSGALPLVPLFIVRSGMLWGAWPAIPFFTVYVYKNNGQSGLTLPRLPPLLSPALRIMSAPSSPVQGSPTAPSSTPGSAPSTTPGSAPSTTPGSAPSTTPGGASPSSSTQPSSSSQSTTPSPPPTTSSMSSSSSTVVRSPSPSHFLPSPSSR